MRRREVNVTMPPEVVRMRASSTVLVKASSRVNLDFCWHYGGIAARRLDLIGVCSIEAYLLCCGGVKFGAQRRFRFTMSFRPSSHAIDKISTPKGRVILAAGISLAILRLEARSSK